jgi:peptide/nickel transport system ATP-binding protein
MDRLLEVRNLRKTYVRGGGVFADRTKGERFVAVDGVSFEVQAEPDHGQIMFEGRDLRQLAGEALRTERRKMQMVSQGPFASLNPRMKVGEIVAEPMAIHEPRLTARERLGRAAEILKRVGLDESALQRYPHEFSGGQRQRIAIARALILHPKLIIADEPVSALDVSVGAQVLRLLKDLQRELGLTYVFISHSLPVVAQLANHIAVMRAGQIVECGPAERVLEQPTSRYTPELLAAVPEIPHVPVM